MPLAAAAGEFIGPWGRLQSFIAIEELTDMLPLHEAVPAAAAALDPVTFRTMETRPHPRNGVHFARFTSTPLLP